MKPFVRLLALTKPVVPELETAEDLIEFAGRWDYGTKSIAKMGDKGIISRWIDSGEESMLEMADAVFFIECSRVVTHELVRHRIASYQQESQRFVAYDEEEPEDLFFVPPEVLAKGESAEAVYKHAMAHARQVYRTLRDMGVSKQMARYVLPNSTRTRIIVKMNLREWRHVLRLRCHSSAQPEMREVMGQILDILILEYPRIFETIKRELEEGKRFSR